MNSHSADNTDRDFERNIDRDIGSNTIEESEFVSAEEEKQKKKKKIPIKNRVKIEELSNTILFIAVFIGIWQLAYLSGIWPKISLPSPVMVAESFYDLIQDNTLLVSIGMTLYRLLIGFTASIAIGVGVGLAMVKFTVFGKLS